MATAAAASVAQTLDARIVRLDLIDRSTTNPRKRFHRIDELAANVQAKGMRVPMLVRPRPGGRFELVDGERRYKAATLAELATVPVIVENLDDHDAREIQLITLIQRDDAHPLEEADAYRDLMAFDKAYTVEAIAAKVGKDPSYIYKRLKLTELIPEARAAFEQDEITAGHAMELARLSAERQASGLPECFHVLFGDSDGQREPAPLSKLKTWIQKHDKVNLADSTTTQHYFPEVAAQIAEEAEPEKLLQLSVSHQPGADLGDKKSGVLGSGRWTAKVAGKNRCANIQRGVIVHGGPLEVVDVCATKGCPKHFPTRAEAPSLSERNATHARERESQEARERKDREAREAWDALRPVAIQALADHLKGTKLDAGLLRMALSQADDVVGLIGALSPAKAGQALALDIVLSGGTWNKDRFLQSVKPFKFNLAKVEKVMKEKPAAAPKKKGRR